MFLAILPKDLLTISIVFFMISWRFFICFLASRFSCNFFRERFLIRPKSDEIKWAIISFCCWLLTDFISSLHFELSGVQFGLNVVSWGDWLGKPANIKVGNNGAAVYVETPWPCTILCFSFANCDWIDQCDVSIDRFHCHATKK